MVSKKRSRPKVHTFLENRFSRIVAERCTKEAATKYILLENIVGTRCTRADSYRVLIERAARTALIPITIASLPPEFDKPGYWPRGDTFFGDIGDYFDRIALRCGMRWWINDEGLAMDQIEPGSNLSDFDAIAGKLSVELSQKGRLSKESLAAIVMALDEQKMPLKGNLQPHFWNELDKYNRFHPSKPIKTFQQALRRPGAGPRAIRLALYPAKKRYLKALARAKSAS